MSPQPPDNFEGVPEERPEGAGVEQMPVEEPRRAASLTLRSDELRESRAASMEAANKSLADAIRITYRLLQLVMIALGVLFVFSGFQQVNQAESGIRVALGRIQTEKLEPGFQFSLPYPLGEIIKVETGTRSAEIDEAFWPKLREEEKRRPLDELGLGGGSLEPGKDGSLLTGDSNIAHAQWSVLYSRVRPADYIKNLYTPDEQALVKAAVERAAVRVAAEVNIDELLKPGAAGADGSSQRENGVESRVRRIAQEMLDQIGSGIEVGQVLLRSASPPLRVRREFNQVQDAQSKAGKARDQALGERSKTLNEVAGSASQPLLDLIDRYEAVLELGKLPEANAILATINEVLEGKHDTANADIAGRAYEAVRLSGDVARVISDAQQYRSSIVQQSQRQAETFRAKRSQYQANPSVFVTNELVDALKSFLSLKTVQTFWVPDDSQSFELLITPDPQVAREAESEKYRKDIEANPRLQNTPK